MVFFTIVILTIFFAYPYQEGIHPCDPGDYCKCAVQFLRGELDFNNFYCNRIGSWLPIAIALKLWGFNGYYLGWINIFGLALLITVVYLALRKYNGGIAHISCAIIGFAPVILKFTAGLWMDIMAVLSANLCILWIWHFRFIAVNPRPIVAGMILTMMWCFAIITKESAFYYLLPILIVFIDDKRMKQHNRFWNAAIITGIGISILLLSAYVLKTGELFQRVRLLESVPNTHSYVGASWKVMLARVTVLPLKFLLSDFSYYTVFVPSLLQLFNKSENDKEKFLKMYMVSLMVLWWFGTQSFNSWKPVLLEYRIWLPLMVPMAINAAHVFFAIIQGNASRYSTWRTKIILSVVAVFVCIAAVGNEENIFGEINSVKPSEFVLGRISMLIFLFLAIFHQGAIPSLIEAIKQGLSFIKHNYAFVMLLLLGTVYNIQTSFKKNPADNNYLSDKEMIEMVANTENTAIIISESCVYSNNGIYYGFNPDVAQRIHFMNWNTVSESQIEKLAEQQHVYMLVSKDRTLWYTRVTKLELKLHNPLDSVPGYVLNPGLHWELIKGNSRTSLYKFKKQD